MTTNFLDKFSLREEVRNVFTQSLIEDPDKILRVLEEYKFMQRDNILQILKGSDTYEFVSVENNRHYKTYDDCTIYCINEQDSTASVYINGFHEINSNRIELDLSKYTTTFYRVTPMNFDQIVYDNYYPNYDPVILFKRIILAGLDAHATDIHFDVKHFSVDPSYTVSFRIDGDIEPYNEFIINERLNREMISKIVESKTNVTSLDLNSPDGITAVAKDIFGTNIVELRISASRVLDGFHYVIRLQRKDTVEFTLDQLGFAPAVLDDLRYVVRKRSGITLITGAVRTGKNTTAFAIENEMVNLPIKLVSYEYPIEVLMPVSQVDYANDENVLLNAIRLAKKQDVNVAFLNEIPNKEVAFAVQDLVNSSIHVITTMHLDRLWFLPYRLKEYYGTSYKDVISQINAVFNQKMFNVPCPYCSETYLVDEISDNRKRALLEKHGVKLYRSSKGCQMCENTGHIIGKNQPYAEHLVFTPDLISALLKCDEPYQMELVLHDAVTKQHTALEDYIVSAVSNGSLSLDALDAII